MEINQEGHTYRTRVEPAEFDDFTQRLTLAEFLLARIAEDEEVAHDESRDPWKELRWVGPKRALAECEAKRRIVEEHAEHIDGGRCRTCQDHEDHMVNQAYPCLTLRLLAQPYADHPDFREEWRA